MSEKKQILSVAFSKIKSFEEVTDTNNSEKILDAQECFSFKSPAGHQSNWTRVLLNFSGIETLKGFQEGLKTLHANCCTDLKCAVGLPASCEEAYFDSADIRALYEIDQALFRATYMTPGLKVLSLKRCQNLYTLRGIAPTCETVMVDETPIVYLRDLPQTTKNVSATWCKNLKSTKGLPASCEYLDLSFSGVETLEDIPATIKEVRVYNCSALKKECLKSVPLSVLPKIKGLDSDAAEYAQMLLTAAHKKMRKAKALQSQNIKG